MTQPTNICPVCGRPTIDVRRYLSMMVLSRTHALFTLRCPECHEAVSLVEEIPPELHEQVLTVAHEVHAGMGQNPTL